MGVCTLHCINGNEWRRRKQEVIIQSPFQEENLDHKGNVKKFGNSPEFI